MQKYDNDEIELTSVGEPKSTNTGSGFMSEEAFAKLVAKKKKEGWTLCEVHHDDPRDEHWSGYLYWTRTGRPLSEVSLWDRLFFVMNFS